MILEQIAQWRSKMEQPFAPLLERMLEIYRVSSPWNRMLALWWLERMCEYADSYSSHGNGSSNPYSMQNTLPVLLERYEEAADEPQRQKLLEDFSRIAYHADLTCAMQGPPILNVGEASTQAFLSFSLSRLERCCVCCGRLMEEKQLFCPPCSRHADKERTRRRIAHLLRRLS